MDLRLLSFLVILSLIFIVSANEESKTLNTRMTKLDAGSLVKMQDENSHQQRRKRQIGWAISNYAMPYAANSLYNYNPYTGSAMSSVSNNYLGYPYAVNAYTGYGPFGAPYAFNEVVVGK